MTHTEAAELILLTRIEQAPLGSRELDAEIWLSIEYPDYVFPDEVLNRRPHDRVEAVGRFTHDGFGGGGTASPYTTSLDAALTLVPREWKVRQMHFNGPCADDRKWHLNLWGGDVGKEAFVGRGATPALALAAAAMRVRGL